ncbi:MAG TPA: quinone oxidoreductase [Woeseiaceae bacterium]|nr:quinone oxidoreductase [Woeseiaceae bacterium]
MSAPASESHVIRFRMFGGPEVLEHTTIRLPAPGPDEAQIRHTAIGLNFIDTYHRDGLYPLELPSGLGSEAAGVVQAVGARVTTCKPGDRVAYAGGPVGSYAEYRNYPAERLVPVPENVSDEQAAAVMLKGLTAWYLLRRSYVVQPGDSILLYAAAGGVGSIASQWAHALGARVIGIVSTEEKAALARSQGCDHIIMADHGDIAGAVRGLTGGAGVAAVYDSVGKDTFFTSLDCLRPHGTMVSFGNSSGAVEPFSPAELAKRHSLYVTRPILFDFVATREELLAASEKLFGRIADGSIRVRVAQSYALRDAALAHRDLEARRTTGSTVLVPR